MSAGPIKQWRDAHAPAKVSVTAKTRICAPAIGTGRSVCGRRKQKTATWDKVTCPECKAASRADG